MQLGKLQLQRQPGAVCEYTQSMCTDTSRPTANLRHRRPCLPSRLAGTRRRSPLRHVQLPNRGPSSIWRVRLRRLRRQQDGDTDRRGQQRSDQMISWASRSKRVPTKARPLVNSAMVKPIPAKHNFNGTPMGSARSTSALIATLSLVVSMHACVRCRTDDRCASGADYSFA